MKRNDKNNIKTIVKPFYTLSELANIFGCSHQSLYLKHYRKTSALPIKKFGSVNVVYLSDLKESCPDLYESLSSSAFINSLQANTIETENLLSTLTEDDNAITKIQDEPKSDTSR